MTTTLANVFNDMKISWIIFNLNNISVVFWKRFVDFLTIKTNSNCLLCDKRTWFSCDFVITWIRLIVDRWDSRPYRHVIDTYGKIGCFSCANAIFKFERGELTMNQTICSNRSNQILPKWHEHYTKSNNRRRVSFSTFQHCCIVVYKWRNRIREQISIEVNWIAVFCHFSHWQCDAGWFPWYLNWNKNKNIIVLVNWR